MSKQKYTFYSVWWCDSRLNIIFESFITTLLNFVLKYDGFCLLYLIPVNNEITSFRFRFNIDCLRIAVAVCCVWFSVRSKVEEGFSTQNFSIQPGVRGWRWSGSYIDVPQTLPFGPAHNLCYHSNTRGASVNLIHTYFLPDTTQPKTKRTTCCLN